MNILHSYRAWKWIRKMKKEDYTNIQEKHESWGKPFGFIEESRPIDWSEYKAWEYPDNSVFTSYINAIQKMYDIRFESLKDHYKSTFGSPFTIRYTTRAHSWKKFGWRYFNKYNGWNWLAGLTKSK